MPKNKWPSSEEAKETATVLIFFALAGIFGFAFWKVFFTAYWYISSHFLALLLGSVFGLILGERK